jgi:hypothetical protein
MNIETIEVATDESTALADGTGWSKYLGRAPGGADVSEHAAAARRVELGGLPSTWIGVGTLDLVYDEDLD